MQSTLALRREVVTVCRRLHERGLVAGQDGNVSVRVADDCVLVTPAGLSKVDVGAGDLVEVSLAGERRGGARGASSELLVHLRVYERRADARAVVHAHPPTATAFSVAGERLPAEALPEIMFHMGEVATVPYVLPGTAALAAAFDPFLSDHDAFLMANHGATTLGPSLRTAHQRMESLEHAARIVLGARLLGRVNALTPDDLRTLAAARDLARGRDAHTPQSVRQGT